MWTASIQLYSLKILRVPGEHTLAFIFAVQIFNLVYNTHQQANPADQSTNQLVGMLFLGR